MKYQAIAVTAYGWVGASALVYGVAQIYPPAAWIVAGVYVLADSFLISRATADVQQSD